MKQLSQIGKSHLEKEENREREGERAMRNGAMANSQTPEQLRSDPPELGIRFLIQILGWILGFFLKLGPSEILSLLSDVILCVFVGNKETEQSAHGHRLVFRVHCKWCQQQKE